MLFQHATCMALCTGGSLYGFIQFCKCVQAAPGRPCTLDPSQRAPNRHLIL